MLLIKIKKSDGLDFTNYRQLAFVAENGALPGVIKHLQGYFPMPQNGNQLDGDSCIGFNINRTSQVVKKKLAVGSLQSNIT